MTFFEFIDYSAVSTLIINDLDAEGIFQDLNMQEKLQIKSNDQ